MGWKDELKNKYEDDSFNALSDNSRFDLIFDNPNDGDFSSSSVSSTSKQNAPKKVLTREEFNRLPPEEQEKRIFRAIMISLPFIVAIVILFGVIEHFSGFDEEKMMLPKKVKTNQSTVNVMQDEHHNEAEDHSAKNKKIVKESKVIQMRLRDRKLEHRDQSYSTYVMPLNLTQGEKNIGNLDGLDYFIYWDSVVWNLKTTKIPLEDKLDSESKFRMYIGSWMDYGLYHYIKEHEQLFAENDTFSLCLTMKGKTVIDDVVLYLNDKANKNQIHAGLTDYLNQRLLKRTHKYWDNTFESIKMCYTIFHTTQDNWMKAHQIKKTEDYPNVVIQNVKWEHDSPGAVKDLAKYEDLLAQKFELIRQDIGKCVADYEKTDMTMSLTLGVSPTGGTIYVDNSSSSFRTYDEAIQLDRCLELGVVLPYLMNDVGVRTEESSRVEVTFSVSPKNIKNVRVPEEIGDVGDEMNSVGQENVKPLPPPVVPSPRSNRKAIHNTLLDLQRVTADVCHPSPGKVNIQIVLSPAGKVVEAKAKERVTGVTETDLKCIYSYIQNAKFEPFEGSDIHILFPFKYE